MQQDTDVLTCGACQKTFALGDIVKFIQHKVLACNKENYCSEPGNNNVESGDSDGEVGVVVRRPSISAPMKRSEEPRCSTPKRRAAPSSASPTPIKAELESSPSLSSPDEGPSKKLRTDFVDAQSNTTNSGSYSFQILVIFKRTFYPNIQGKCYFSNLLKVKKNDQI